MSVKNTIDECNEVNMYKFKGVIFDLDGVVCSTDSYHYTAWKQILDGVGIELDMQTNDKLRGLNREDYLSRLLQMRDITMPAEKQAELCEIKNNLYVQLLQNLSISVAPSDLVHTLTTLKSRGAKIAIGSSSKNARFALQQLGVLDMFDAISDGVGLVNAKPDPEVFLKAASLLNLQPCDCLVVEDATLGVDAGKAGGFTTAGISVASTYDKTDYKIQHLSDLLNI